CPRLMAWRSFAGRTPGPLRLGRRSVDSCRGHHVDRTRTRTGIGHGAGRHPGIIATNCRNIVDMAGAIAAASGMEDFASAHSRARIVCELAIAYALILLVIWTPRPLQKLLWWVAAGAVVAISIVS